MNHAVQKGALKPRADFISSDGSSSDNSRYVVVVFI